MSVAVGYTLVLLVLAALVGAALVLRRRRPGVAGIDSGRLRLLDSVAVGVQQRVVLLECDGMRWLLSQGADGVRLVDRVPPARETQEDAW